MQWYNLNSKFEEEGLCGKRQHTVISLSYTSLKENNTKIRSSKNLQLQKKNASWSSHSEHVPHNSKSIPALVLKFYTVCT